MEEQRQEPKRPFLNKGMFTSTSPLDQPMGTVRYARNSNLNETLGAWSNEHGVSLATQIPGINVTVIGCIPLTDDRIVLFLNTQAGSEIGVWVSDSYNTLYRPVPTQPTALNFSEDNPINGTFSEQANGDVMVYWTDDLNPPRALNITRQASSSIQLLYGKDPQTSPDTLQSGRLNLFPHGGPVPHTELVGVFSGGGCRTGSYQIALGYRDGDLIPTNTLTVGNPVPIVDEHEGINPIESYDGAPPDVLSGKSITWNVSNINTDMKYLTVAVIASIGEVRFAYRLEDVEIRNRTSFDISFTGPQTASTESPENVLTDRVEYSKAKTMEQLDNLLFMGNLESDEDIGYQPYANLIKSKACTVPLNPFDSFWMTDDFLMRKRAPLDPQDIRKGYRYPKNVHDLKGYQRDEVYAFYIAFILKSGKMSYAYHIPGRPALENVPVDQLEKLSNEAGPLNQNLNLQSVNEDGTLRDQLVNAWEIINMTGTWGQTAVAYMYQWFDFSHLPGSRDMNYWRNLNEFYPDNDNWLVRDAQSPNTPAGDLRSTGIRHHRFPGNRNRDFTTVKSSNASDIKDLKVKKKAVVHWFWFGAITRKALGSDVLEVTDPFGGPGTDWQGARANSDGGDSLGGLGPNHDQDIPGAFTGSPSNNKCTPELNLRLRSGVLSGLLGCKPDSLQDVEYIYDTALPNTLSLPVFVAWDPPFTNYIAQNLAPCQGGSNAPHCFRAFTGSLKSNSGGVIEIDNVPNNCESPDHIMDRGGFLAWVECEDVLSNDSANSLEHEVQALGICFDDIKVPKSIADKAQGFRIYYAKRTHENRTILGQAPIHPMYERYNVNLGGCHTFNLATHERDYHLPGGIPAPTADDFDQRTFSFHDFYLLRETPSLAQATHLRLQYSLGMFSFAGPTLYNIDGVESQPAGTGSNSPPAIFSCFRPQVITSFHISGNHQQPEDIQLERLNFLLQDKARAYILGNTIYEAANSGFEMPIYNIGGHTHIALRTLFEPPYLPSGQQAIWRQLRSDRAGLKYAGYTDVANGQPWPGNDLDWRPEKDAGFMVHLANLHAFKTDVYSPVDNQQLVWTGHEVVGENFNRFIVQDDLSSPNLPNPFSTGPVFGGDTYICRYGYRMTHREEVASVPFSFPDSSGMDHKTVLMTIVESTENINFRHIENDKIPYFPGDTLPNVLKVKADVDLTYNPDTTTGNIRYNKDYSLVNDAKVVLPYPIHLEVNTDFPVRVIRSDRTSASQLVDGYRFFRANEFRDLSNRYGELWKISAMNNLLLFHMEDSLFITKGKQTLKTGEGSDAFIGSGDLFEQEPDIVVHTDAGYMGTLSMFSCLVTPQGYFFVDIRNRKIFMVGESGKQDLSSDNYGMDDWFRNNLPYELESYGYFPETDSFITGLGFHAVWDQRFERVILTKRDLEPGDEFKQLFKGKFNRLVDVPANLGAAIVSVQGKLWSRPDGNSPWSELVVKYDTVSPVTTQSGGIFFNLPLFSRKSWTISFKVSRAEGSVGAWESFHDYVPYMYSFTGTEVVSFKDFDSGLYRHNDMLNPGQFYGQTYPFEIETVIRTQGITDLLFHAFSFLTEVQVTDPVTGSPRLDHSAGFTSFSAYTSDHFTGESPLEYLINVRRIGSEWRVNQLRDLSKQAQSTAAYYTGPFTQGNYGYQGMTVTGMYNQETLTGTQDAFYTINGMYSTPNLNALDLNKPWYLQSKMSGRYLGIRLVNDNLDRKLVNLHSVLADHRPYRK